MENPFHISIRTTHTHTHHTQSYKKHHFSFRQKKGRLKKSVHLQLSRTKLGLIGMYFEIKNKN